MPGPLLTLRALGGSNSTSTDIVTDARYQLARPDLVNGVPSLSLVSSNQACTVRTYIDGVFNTSLTVATTGSIPMLNASGAMLSAVELAALTFDVSGLQYAEVLHVTDEPAGSPTSPFASTAEIVAAGVGATETPWVLNPLAPLGRTQAYFADGVWAPIPGQCIALYRGEGGALLLNMTAVGRTTGTWYRIWQPTDPIPDWLLPNYRNISLQARLDISEASNAGSSSVVLGLRTNSTPISDVNNSIIARTSNGSQYGNGIPALLVSAERRGSSFYGPGGAALSGQGDRLHSSFASGQTRPALDVNFALTTNVLKMWYVALWSGV